MSRDAKLVTDKWRGYDPLNKHYNIEQKLSNSVKNFKELHIMIMQLKSWIRATPTHISKWHAKAYLDEFCFRLNRSQFKESIFHKAVCKMVESEPIFQSKIKQMVSV